MGRPPSYDKVVIKKGPWTPEEDIILVSYIQEHGPGNWFAVPTNTGLLRCSKSCRLRWTNYLKPGIKRGNFTPHEEGMIIHLQALFGNKWAAIASYLPQRTDNDIKNFWNTHLKKKLKKLQSSSPLEPKHQSSIRSTENSSVYASSSQNISRLLQEWKGSSSSSSSSLSLSSPLKDNTTSTTFNLDQDIRKTIYGDIAKIPTEFGDDSTLLQYYRPQQIDNGASLISNDKFDCSLSFDRSFIINEKSSRDSSQKGSESNGLIDREKIDTNPPLSFLDDWLFDGSANQVVAEEEEDMELPPIFLA